MSQKPVELLEPVGRISRRVAAAVIAGVYRRMSFEEVEARLAARPAREQAVITGLTLAALGLVSFLFAQFGLVGMPLFLLLVILIVN